MGLSLRRLGVVELTQWTLIFLERLWVNNVRNGEDILSTHVESVTQFKPLNDSHSVIFLHVVSGGRIIDVTLLLELTITLRRLTASSKQ